MKLWTTKGMITGVILLFASSAARADAPSAGHVGALQYIEGHAFVDGKAVAGNQEKLPILNEGSMLSTAKGHAEMLLTPGVFLRLDNQSAIRLTAAGLADTSVLLLRGSAMLEVDDLHKDNLIRVQVGKQTTRVLQAGLYRFDTQPGGVEVLDGKAAVTEGDRTLKAGKHHEIEAADFQLARFKSETDDGLSRWSRLRSEYESEASVSSAQYVYDMGMPWGFSDWFWNPWFDSWTWLPASGFCMNPYGFGYWSPWMVYSYFPQRYYGNRSFAFTPNAGGRMSPSGLNLQRGAAVRVARNNMMAGGGFSRGYGGGGMRSMGGGMRSMGGGMGGGMRGGGFHGGR